MLIIILDQQDQYFSIGQTTAVETKNTQQNGIVDIVTKKNVVKE